MGWWGQHTRKKNKQDERTLQKEVLHYLALIGVFAWHCKTQGQWDPEKQIFRKTYSLKGVADIIGIVEDGRMLAIELKSKTGRVSPEQREFIEKVKSMGGIAGFARCLQDVKELLKSAGLCIND